MPNESFTFACDFLLHRWDCADLVMFVWNMQKAMNWDLSLNLPRLQHCNIFLLYLWSLQIQFLNWLAQIAEVHQTISCWLQLSHPVIPTIAEAMHIREICFCLCCPSAADWSLRPLSVRTPAAFSVYYWKGLDTIRSTTVLAQDHCYSDNLNE